VEIPKAAAQGDIPSSVLTTAKGSGILAVGKLIETVGRFVLAFLLARMLGADQFGQYTIALATSALFASFGKFGMDSAVVRYLAMAAEKRDEAGVWGALQVTIGFAFGASLLCGLALFFLAGPIANAIYGEPQLVSLLQLGGLMVPLAVLNDMLIGASRGFKRMHFSVIAQDIAHLLVRLVLLGLLFITGMDPFWAVATYGAADLCSILILAYLLNGVFPWRRSLATARHDVRGILGFSVPLFLSEILKRFRGDIQTILLGALYTVSSVGVFTVANKINLTGRITSFSLMTSAEPAFAELHARSDKEQMGELYRVTSRWMFILNFPVVFVSVLFARPILSIFGESYVSGATALILLSLASLVNVSTGLGGTVIDMTGYTKLKLVNSVTQITLFVVTSVLFIPRWGVVGAASAAMVSSSIIQAARMAQVAYLFRISPYDRAFAKVAVCAGVTVGVGYITRWAFATDTAVLSAALHAVALIGLYMATTWQFALTPQDRAIVARMVARLYKLLDKRRMLAGGRLPAA